MGSVLEKADQDRTYSGVERKTIKQETPQSFSGPAVCEMRKLLIQKHEEEKKLEPRFKWLTIWLEMTKRLRAVHKNKDNFALVRTPSVHVPSES